jgi:hypothetical protein
MCHEETATLINKEKEAGSYEFQFNEINLLSGLSFCRIFVNSYGESGEFQQLKKMILKN